MAPTDDGARAGRSGLPITVAILACLAPSARAQLQPPQADGSTAYPSGTGSGAATTPYATAPYSGGTSYPGSTTSPGSSSYPGNGGYEGYPTYPAYPSYPDSGAYSYPTYPGYPTYPDSTQPNGAPGNSAYPAYPAYPDANQPGYNVSPNGLAPSAIVPGATSPGFFAPGPYAPGPFGQGGPGLYAPSPYAQTPYAPGTAPGLNDMLGPQPVQPFAWSGRAVGLQPFGPGTQTPPFFVWPRGGVELTYTDNVAVTNTHPQSDFIVSPDAGLYAQAETAHTTLRFDGTLSYDFYDKTTSYDGARFDALGDVRTVLLDQAVEVDGRLATNQQQISIYGPTPATDRSFGQNEAQILNYGFTPTVRFRVGDFMNTELSYDFSSVDYLSTAASNVSAPYTGYYSNTGRARLTSGYDFSVLTWEIDGSVQQQNVGSYASDWRSGSGSLSYALWPDFQLVGTLGYDDVTNPGYAGSASGTYETAGFRWAVGPHTHISFDGGQRYNEPYYNARIDYTRTKAIQLHASYIETIDTPLNVLSENLASAVSNPNAPLTGTTPGMPAGTAPTSPTSTGSLSSSLGATPGSPLNNVNYNPYGLAPTAFRRKSLDIGFNGTIYRTTYTVDIVSERLQSGPFKGDDQRAYGQITQPLTLNLEALLSASFSRVSGYEFSPGLTAKTAQVRGGVNYNISSKAAVSLTYYRQRIIAFPVDTRENALELVLTHAF